eukprot:8881646-Ditylum_brightwellii.AAC.1
MEFWIAALQAGIVETASDGTVKDGKGTYVVIFTAGERELWFQGLVDCHPSLIQSYRVELTGLSAIRLLLKHLRDCSNEEIVSDVVAYVNNKATITANNQNEAYPGVAFHTASDVDLLQEIWSHHSITQ